jgi:hypothetical protein
MFVTGKKDVKLRAEAPLALSIGEKPRRCYRGATFLGCHAGIRADVLGRMLVGIPA